MPTLTRSAFSVLHPDSLNLAEPPCTDPYARWCDRERPRGPTYVDSAEQAAWVRGLLREDAERAHDHYEELLNENPEDPSGEPLDPGRDGLARELARINLSLNHHTQWYWKTDLHNLLNFLQLRAGPHAQHEIRVYAEAMLERFVKPWTPLVHEAFLDYRLGARTLSRQELQVVRALVRGRRGEVEEMWDGSGISPRERQEFLEALGLGE